MTFLWGHLKPKTSYQIIFLGEFDQKFKLFLVLRGSLVAINRESTPPLSSTFCIPLRSTLLFLPVISELWSYSRGRKQSCLTIFFSVLFSPGGGFTFAVWQLTIDSIPTKYNSPRLLTQSSLEIIFLGYTL